MASLKLVEQKYYMRCHFRVGCDQNDWHPSPETTKMLYLPIFSTDTFSNNKNKNNKDWQDTNSHTKQSKVEKIIQQHIIDSQTLRVATTTNTFKAQKLHDTNININGKKLKNIHNKKSSLFCVSEIKENTASDNKEADLLSQHALMIFDGNSQQLQEEKESYKYNYNYRQMAGNVAQIGQKHIKNVGRYCEMMEQSLKDNDNLITNKDLKQLIGRICKVGQCVSVYSGVLAIGFGIAANYLLEQEQKEDKTLKQFIDQTNHNFKMVKKTLQQLVSDNKMLSNEWKYNELDQKLGVLRDKMKRILNYITIHDDDPNYNNVNKDLEVSQGAFYREFESRKNDIEDLVVYLLEKTNFDIILEHGANYSFYLFQNSIFHCVGLINEAILYLLYYYSLMIKMKQYQKWHESYQLNNYHDSQLTSKFIAREDIEQSIYEYNDKCQAFNKRYKKTIHCLQNEFVSHTNLKTIFQRMCDENDASIIKKEYYDPKYKWTFDKIRILENQICNYLHETYFWKYWFVSIFDNNKNDKQQMSTIERRSNCNSFDVGQINIQIGLFDYNFNQLINNGNGGILQTNITSQIKINSKGYINLSETPPPKFANENNNDFVNFGLLKRVNNNVNVFEIEKLQININHKSIKKDCEEKEKEKEKGKNSCDKHDSSNKVDVIKKDEYKHLTYYQNCACYYKEDKKCLFKISLTDFVDFTNVLFTLSVFYNKEHKGMFTRGVTPPDKTKLMVQHVNIPINLWSFDKWITLQWANNTKNFQNIFSSYQNLVQQWKT